MPTMAGRLSLLLAGAAATAILAAAAPASAAPLDPWRWTVRPLLIFAPRDGDPLAAEQARILAADAAGVAERDMAVLVVGPDRVTGVLGAEPPSADPALFRSRYGVTAGTFRAILVGKDGGVKLVSDEPVSTGRLFALIDGMPMRRREIRDRGG